MLQVVVRDTLNDDETEYIRYASMALKVIRSYERLEEVKGECGGSVYPDFDCFPGKRAVLRGFKLEGGLKECLLAQPANQAYNFDNTTKYIETERYNINIGMSVQP